jgi:hypothetical protein
MAHPASPLVGKSTHLHEQVREMKHGDHYCLVYETPEQRWAAILPFITAGLERNGVCAYITDGPSIDEMRQALQAHGVDVEGHMRRGGAHVHDEA